MRSFFLFFFCTKRYFLRGAEPRQGRDRHLRGSDRAPDAALLHAPEISFSAKEEQEEGAHPCSTPQSTRRWRSAQRSLVAVAPPGRMTKRNTPTGRASGSARPASASNGTRPSPWGSASKHRSQRNIRRSCRRASPTRIAAAKAKMPATHVSQRHAADHGAGGTGRVRDHAEGHLHLFRKYHAASCIYTDGRSFPDYAEPSFDGYSIGRWTDEDGDGRYDLLDVELCNMKGPRTIEASGLPLHKDNATIVKERISLDRNAKDTLQDEITTFDHAFTRPWMNHSRNTRARRKCSGMSSSATRTTITW